MIFQQFSSPHNGMGAQALSFGKQHWPAGGGGRAGEIFLRELPTHLLLPVPSPLGSSCPLLPWAWGVHGPSPCLHHLHLSAALLKLSFPKPLARREREMCGETGSGFVFRGAQRAAQVWLSQVTWHSFAPILSCSS